VTNPYFVDTLLSEEEKVVLIQHHFAQIMSILGLDLSDPDLARTPQRVAQMYVKELFCGLNEASFPSLSYVSDESCRKEQGMVFIKDASIKSMCEHHFIPFFGTASVAYLPYKKVIGLSKIHRIIDHFCRRPQIQERLTVQIAESLMKHLETEDVAVIIQAKHLCVFLRGVGEDQSTTVTTAFHGKFEKEPYIQDSFYRNLLIK